MHLTRAWFAMRPPQESAALCRLLVWLLPLTKIVSFVYGEFFASALENAVFTATEEFRDSHSALSGTASRRR
jgi:hypothetical protein